MSNPGISTCGPQQATGAGEKRFYPQRGITIPGVYTELGKPQKPQLSITHEAEWGGPEAHLNRAPRPLTWYSSAATHEPVLPRRPSFVPIFLAEMNALPPFSTGWDPTHPLTPSSSNSAYSVQPSPPRPSGLSAPS